MVWNVFPRFTQHPLVSHRYHPYTKLTIAPKTSSFLRASVENPLGIVFSKSGLELNVPKISRSFEVESLPLLFVHNFDILSKTPDSDRSFGL